MDIPTSPNLIQGSYSMAMDRPVVLQEVPGLSSTTAGGRQGLHRTYGKGIAFRVGARHTLQMPCLIDSVSVGRQLNPTRAMRQGLTHLHPVDAEQFRNRKHITLGSPLICLFKQHKEVSRIMTPGLIGDINDPDTTGRGTQQHAYCPAGFWVSWDNIFAQAQGRPTKVLLSPVNSEGILTRGVKMSAWAAATMK